MRRLRSAPGKSAVDDADPVWDRIHPASYGLLRALERGATRLQVDDLSSPNRFPHGCRALRPPGLPGIERRTARLRGRRRRVTREFVLTAPNVDDDLVPIAMLGPLDELVEPAAALGEAGIAVPGFPVPARSLRADDHPPVRVALRAKQLSADPAGTLLRGSQPLAQGGIPLVLGPSSHVNVSHDRHHCFTLLVVTCRHQTRAT